MISSWSGKAFPPARCAIAARWMAPSTAPDSSPITSQGRHFVAQAVALAVGISQSQAFFDGNKRAAYAAAHLFLLSNGIRFDGDPITFACWLICVAGRISNDDLDEVADHLGLDLAAELDGMHREDVAARFEVWLRAHVSDDDGDGP